MGYPGAEAQDGRHWLLLLLGWHGPAPSSGDLWLGELERLERGEWSGWWAGALAWAPAIRALHQWAAGRAGAGEQCGALPLKLSSTCLDQVFQVQLPLNAAVF